MNSNRLMSAFAACVAATILVACGGGSSTAGIDGTGVTGPMPPSSSPAFAFGTLTAFGSVFVNGVRFDTSAATFSIDGAAGIQSDLAVGDVVLVSGTIDPNNPAQGTATSVLFDDAVEGPIQSLDDAAGTLAVLGQSVIISASTSFDDSIQPRSIDGLALGQVIEVSGLIRSDGAIDATRVEPKPASVGWETTGRVTGHNGANFSFMINALTVDYSTALLQDFSGGVIADGDLVEVKGGTTLGANGELIAARVEFKGSQIGASTGDRLEVEGFITRFIDATDFDVSGLAVTTNAQTTFVGGVAGDLGLDIKLEAEGTLNASGVLVATKIDIRRARAIRLYAAVDSTSPAGSGSIAGTGSFVALGIAIDVDALTGREDKTSQKVSPFGVGDLAVGDFVEVRGTEFPSGSGRILAGRVERDDPDDTELQGFVTNVSNPDVTVLGVTIMTNTSTVFRDATNSPISSTQFFSDVVAASGGNAGSLVKAKGQEMGPQMLLASELQFEIE